MHIQSYIIFSHWACTRLISAAAITWLKLYVCVRGGWRSKHPFHIAASTMGGKARKLKINWLITFPFFHPALVGFIKGTRQSKKRFFYCIFRKYYLFWIKCRLVYSKIRKIVDLAAKNVKRQPIASPLPRNFKRVFLEYFLAHHHCLCATKIRWLLNFFMKISNFYGPYQRFGPKWHMF